MPFDPYFSELHVYILVMGDRLNFIIDHRLESVEAFDAILPIIIGSNIFTELSTFYAPKGNSGASGYYLYPHWGLGFKSRMCPPYPHACRKRRLKWGAVI